MSEVRICSRNWLYNASVIGLLQSASEIENINVESFMRDDGTVVLPDEFFKQLDIEKRYFSESKISSIVGNNTFYKNYLQKGQENLFKSFVHSLGHFHEGYCDICGRGKYLYDDVVQYLNEQDPAKSEATKFISRIGKYSMVHNSYLGPSSNEFPNGVYGDSHLKVCHLCSFLLLHHHLAFTRLLDGTKVFINTPSLKETWMLNEKIESLGVSSYKEARQKAEILSMSLIKYARVAESTLGAWGVMNAEIISISSDNSIEYYKLNYDTVRILTDKTGAAILDSIDESKVLKAVINYDLRKLMEMGYKLMRNDEIYISRTFRNKTRKNRLDAALGIFGLCSIMRDKTKQNKEHMKGKKEKQELIDVSQILKRIKEKLKNGTVDVNDFKEAYETIEVIEKELYKLNKKAVTICEDDDAMKEKSVELQRYLKEHEGMYSLQSRLVKLGFLMSKDLSIRKSFENSIFRIMELVRRCDRSEAMYAILRIFTTHGREIPAVLLRAFDKNYSDEDFKILLFSFLTSLQAKNVTKEN